MKLQKRRIDENQEGKNQEDKNQEPREQEAGTQVREWVTRLAFAYLEHA
jgi:hypothetical protein